jgi:hypothetical protein
MQAQGWPTHKTCPAPLRQPTAFLFACSKRGEERQDPARA